MSDLRRARFTERNVIGRLMSTTVWETRSRYQDLSCGGVSSHSWRSSGARSVLRCLPSELFELAGGRQSGGGDRAVRQRGSQMWLPIPDLLLHGHGYR